MAGYNYTSFDADDYELVQFDGPEMGSSAPDLSLLDLDGNERRLLEFEGDFLVVEFGSITCPLFQTRRRGMERIEGAASVIVYVREAHPGRDVPAHGDMAEKTACGRKLRDADGEARLILVDDMEGTAHRAFGSYPNAVFIINRNGCVVYRSAWNNAGATRRVLQRLRAGKRVRAESMFVPAYPPVALATFRQAGAGSAKDFSPDCPGWYGII
jgi:hypothetical protein